MMGMALAVIGAVAAIPAGAAESLPLAFMRARDYRALEVEDKLALTRDFMRTFCGSLTMPVDAFVRCADSGTARLRPGEPIFDSLKDCVRTLS